MFLFKRTWIILRYWTQWSPLFFSPIIVVTRITLLINCYFVWYLLLKGIFYEGIRNFKSCAQLNYWAYMCTFGDHFWTYYCLIYGLNLQFHTSFDFSSFHQSVDLAPKNYYVSPKNDSVPPKIADVMKDIVGVSDVTSSLRWNWLKLKKMQINGLRLLIDW